MDTNVETNTATLNEVHGMFIKAIKSDFEKCDLQGDSNTPRWGGRHIFKDNNIQAYLYVRFRRKTNNSITYVIANIGVADEFCGGGLISKIIKTVALYAPVEITDLEFECINNYKLFNNLLKRGFFKTEHANCLISSLEKLDDRNKNDI
jgi:hypothetical protein